MTKLKTGDLVVMREKSTIFNNRLYVIEILSDEDNTGNTSQWIKDFYHIGVDTPHASSNLLSTIRGLMVAHYPK